MSDWTEYAAIADRLARLQPSIPPTVRLLAVTKTVPSHRMREAYAAGIRDFGESRVQEAVQKQAELADLPDITWHLIGHLQSNKVNQALHHFQWIHSVDSWAIAQRLNQRAAELQQPPIICLQVKLRPDPTKFGWTVPELLQALPQLQTLNALRICGLMTILPQALTPTEQLSTFQAAQQLAQQIRHHPTYPLPLQELSMGMSSDYPLAIQCGATIIRLGSILFGERNKPTQSEPSLFLTPGTE